MNKAYNKKSKSYRHTHLLLICKKQHIIKIIFNHGIGITNSDKYAFRTCFVMSGIQLYDNRGACNIIALSYILLKNTVRTKKPIPSSSGLRVVKSKVYDIFLFLTFFAVWMLLMSSLM